MNIMKSKPKQPDVLVHGGGSVFHVEPVSLAAREWVDENVPLEAWQWLGSGFGVEHRYIGDLVDGMRGDGLLVGGAS
jgi:hypothetical protein